MARSLSAGNNFAYAGAVLTAAPITMACWFNAAALATHAMMALDDGTTGHRFLMSKQGAGTLLAQATVAGASSQATTTTTYSAGVWNHACAVYASATDRRIFLNGGGKGTSTVSRVPAGIAATRIGYLATPTLEFIGTLAEAAMWSAALTDEEALALALGVNPLRMRPGNLVGYWPLWGNHAPEIDLTANNRPMTANGTPGKADHAPLGMFSPALTGVSIFADDVSPPSPPPPSADDTNYILAPAVVGSMMLRR